MFGPFKKMLGSKADGNAPGRLTWNDAQQHELASAIGFMQDEFFRGVLQTISDGTKRLSRGYRDPLMFKEFFDSDEALWSDFVGHIAGRSVLEIGPCVATAISTWDVAKCRYVIEPLYRQIVEYQNLHFGSNGFGDAIGYAQPAETLIEELAGRIDGALLIRNCLDHTPKWPFILNNVCEYTAPGAYLLLWNDLMHGPGYEAGHFDITDDVGGFRRLIRRFGFEPITEYSDPDNPNLNWGCLARRTSPCERA